MPETAVITDTDSSLPTEVAAQFGIQQVPITIHFGDRSYTCGEDIDDRLLFQLVDRTHQLPTTSAPSPAAFTDTYEQAFRGGAKSIVCVCVSSQMSSTYSSALTACEQFPGADIAVIDSHALSMGQGFMALAAAEAARTGASRAEVVKAAADAGSRAHLFAVLPTLKYLALSGRVGKFVAGMADTLNIKPILTVQEGKLVLLERVRTRAKAVERTLELVKAAAGEKGVERMAVLHVNAADWAREFEGQLRLALPCPETILTAEFTPGLSVHAGTGVVGVALVTGK